MSLLTNNNNPSGIEWFRDAVIYEVHVKAFCDGNGDGIGDFQGMLSKLDYLEDLGVTAIWLLPFYPSPLRDDGYDIAEYCDVHPDYGTLEEFKTFLTSAHERGIRVITEVVLNHTSDQHPWFQRSRRAEKGSAWRDFYVWSDDPRRYQEARVIFQDFEHANWSFDPEANSYYWHRFYHHQPDLNFDNPAVQQELLQIVDFWFEMGVDGMRLDAVPYLYEREGTNCENLPETFAFLRTLRKHVEARHADKILLADANQWPEDAVRYFGEGDMCHSAFHFPLMPRMFMALEMENKHPILDILEQTPEIPEGCQWTLFLRNHDELTLEMVTDEERDYMYRIFSKDPRARINLGIRRRLAPLLDNDRRKIELMHALLATMPGTPVIYYGDEIGMGDNYYLGDRDGVRTPMQWNSNKNAGFSPGNPQSLFLPVIIDPGYHYESVNVETQDHSQASLLWWMRRLLAMRNESQAFGRGGMKFLETGDPRILAFIRTHQDESVLVVANLGRFARMAELDLAPYQGCSPKEIFGRTSFQSIGAHPYSLSMGPYGYYIFQLCAPEKEHVAASEAHMPTVATATAQSWAEFFDDKHARGALEKHVLPAYFPRQRWYGGKARRLRGMRILDWPRLGGAHTATDKGHSLTYIALVEVSYDEGDPEIYNLPLAYAPLSPATEDAGGNELPKGSLARVDFPNGSGCIYEAVYDEAFLWSLLDILKHGLSIDSSGGSLIAATGQTLREIDQTPELDLTPKVLGAEQSNTSIRFGQELILKLYRRTERGDHPDLEMVRFLTDKAGFSHIPPYAGALEFTETRNKGQRRKEGVVLGLMQRFVKNQGDAWKQTLDIVGHFYESALEHQGNAQIVPLRQNLAALAMGAPLPEVEQYFTGYALETAYLLGQRTGQMHLALASDDADPAFVPERFTQHYQRAMFQSIRNMAGREFRLLRDNVGSLPAPMQREASEVLDLEPAVLEVASGLTKRKIASVKTRIHGDYHLGQVLFTGKDFVIFDFEGEPARAMSERRLKRSPVRDVAGMIRSFHYAAYFPLLTDSWVREDDVPVLEPWAELWYQYSSSVFLRGWLESVQGSAIAPEDQHALEQLLVPSLLEKAIYEMSYELNNRPAWLIIPLRGIKHLCGESQ